MPYESTASGRLFPPTNENWMNDIDRAVDELKELEEDDGDAPIPAASQSVELEELYYDDGELTVRLNFGDWHASAEIPLRPSQDLQQLLDNINGDFGASPHGSGYFLEADDVTEVTRTTPDSQGRVTLGREYADTPVTLAISTNEPIQEDPLGDVIDVFHRLYGSNPQAPIKNLDASTLADRLASVYGAETVNTAIEALCWDIEEVDA